ncbi:DDE-type integrase/transposase/recombinase [Paracidovorax citrulli]|uniref:Mu transposase C-terminal domain-containing protein n=1 Tax=Paracidovorax citrulli TaxID=80869 RepID=UPI0006628045|nr:Mu transposase C-terminal domain-containing protein [Paracidovorax citrulli]UMT96928.1 DDE-type integrase/transposase/recombinase [Paracidovorax citrulli]
MTWLTARELAGLPGMPTSERRTRDKLVALGASSRPRPGSTGGGGLEYDPASLPAETRAALAARVISTSGSKALALVEQAPVVSFAPPAPPPVPLAPLPAPAPGRRPPSDHDKACADARMVLINQVLELVAIHGVKKACAILALRLASGEAPTELQATARAASQRARGDLVSARTLERYLSIYRAQGWWGLLPAPAPVTATTHVDQDVAAVLGLYHSRDARFRKLSGAAKEVTRQLGRDFDTWRALYARARRALDKLGTSPEASVALIKARHSGSERDVRLPFKKRDTSSLSPLDVFVMDGHQFKAKVRHPDHGAPFAPELTLVLDAATRRIMGWSVSLSENVLAVGDALRHAIAQHGIPAVLYTDNGSGETAKAMDCPVDGFTKRLGIDHRTGIPGKPQGRGIIERSWQTHAINAARKFGSFQGSDVDGGEFRKVAAELAKEQRALRRAQETGEVVRLSTKCPTWAQFIDEIERMAAEYNGQHRHRSLPKRPDGKHMTPDEAWAAKFDASLQHKPSQVELRELFMPAVLRTAKRGQVTLFNQEYQAPELMRRDVDGREVSVRYDIHDPMWVRIYSLDGEYICDAQWQANRIDFMPKAVVQIAREKRVAATVKRREQQIDIALRELGDTVQPAPLSLPEPSAPFLVVPSIPEVSPSLSSLPSSGVEVAQAASGRPFFDSLGERYEWLMGHRDAWDESDRRWVQDYVASDDYEALADYYEGRGLGWPRDPQQVFKGAL